ncbi:MAG: ABC-type transport auxiliary lipoprotein family protein [Planctomycetota bacterium]
MKIERRRWTLGALALAAVTAACIDLEPDPAPAIRWLSLDARADAEPSELPPPAEPALVLARVTVAESIPDRLVRRISPVEVAYDDLARWNEPLDDALRRALEDELYRRRGFVRRGASSGRTLEVELVTFELAAGQASVAAIARLTDFDGVTVFDRRFETAAVVDGSDAGVIAEGLTDGLRDVVVEIADLAALR